MTIGKLSLILGVAVSRFGISTGTVPEGIIREGMGRGY
jgi:hypothetical protein